MPLVQSIREGADRGFPAVLNDEPVSLNAFTEIAKKVARNVAMRNANLDPTRVMTIGV
ncbi:hypothetical protein D3C87_2023160 [compost metagenome]